MGNPTIDFFSLDIEGAESLILRTIPFDKVDIRVLMVEMNHVGGGRDDRNETRQFLAESGYRFYTRLRIDEVYLRNDVKIPKEGR